MLPASVSASMTTMPGPNTPAIRIKVRCGRLRPSSTVKPLVILLDCWTWDLFAGYDDDERKSTRKVSLRLS